MALRSLRKEFAVAVGAGESAIRIDTDEIDDAMKTLTEVCKKHSWELRAFDMAAGLRWFFGEPPPAAPKPPPTRSTNPMDVLNEAAMNRAAATPNVINELTAFLNEPAKPDKAAVTEVMPIVFVMKNFHLAFERDRSIVSSLVQHIVADKVGDLKDWPTLKTSLYDPHEVGSDSDTGKFLVGLMPAEAKLPAEVAPLFKVISHELPDEDELGEILKGVCPPQSDDEDEDDAKALSEEDRKRVCKFALGLTRLQAEGVFSASMVKYGRIVPQYVWEEKSAVLNKEGLVELHQGKEKFKDVAGLNGAKEFMLKLLTPNEVDDADPDVRAKGALFCGPPGVGKSLIAKATGNELGLPTLFVHPGNWFGGIVGESEAKTRKGFQIIKAHAPCIAVIDEVEKVMPSSRGHQGDSGVSSRMEGTFLTNMNDAVEQIFWVFTANDVRRMHEAFFRAERVDAVFYVPLPTAEQRAALWKMYLKKFFPKEVEVGKQKLAFDRAAVLDVDALLADFKKAKKPDPKAFGSRLTMALMCLTADARKAAQEKILKADPVLHGRAEVVNDDGWSPAEIRACCRLSRRLNESLTATKKRIRPVKVSAARVIEALEEWAAEAALDAETGELYVPPDPYEGDDEEEGEERPRSRTSSGKKKRRTVRRVRED